MFLGTGRSGGNRRAGVTPEVLSLSKGRYIGTTVVVCVGPSTGSGPTVELPQKRATERTQTRTSRKVSGPGAAGREGKAPAEPVDHHLTRLRSEVLPRLRRGPRSSRLGGSLALPSGTGSGWSLDLRRHRLRFRGFFQAQAASAERDRKDERNQRPAGRDQQGQNQRHSAGDDPRQARWLGVR